MRDGSSAEGRSEGTLRVLVAEDEWLPSYTLSNVLAQRGYAVVGVAKNGEEAIALCQRERPDVVLMDIRMPGTDGIEATRRIMAERPTCIIMLTALAEQGNLGRAEEAGAMGYVLKPVSVENLKPAIAQARKRYAEFQKRRPER